MKNLLAIAILMTGMASFAQDGKPVAHKSPMAQLTPEQRSDLRVKKLTAELGLNASQQKDMKQLIDQQQADFEKERAAHKSMKESGQKPTADEIYARKSKRLDAEIATNEKVKKILTPEQFEKWSKMKDRHRHGRKHMARPVAKPGE
jgi:hypothetical protein